MLDTITIGHALRRSRELAGMSEKSAARALGVPRSELRSWEAGTSDPDADQVALAASVFGHGVEDVWAERVPIIDPDQPGLLVVGTEHINVWPDGASEAVDNRDVLSRYLAAVRRQRGADDHDHIPLRSDDLAALSMVLDLDDAGLQQVLMDLLDLTPAGAQWALRSMLVGGLVALVATGSLGAGWFAPSASAADSVPAAPTPAVAEVVVETTTTDVSVPGIAVERDADAAPTDGAPTDGAPTDGAPTDGADLVPVEISDQPTVIEREQWDREQQAIEESGGSSATAPDTTTGPATPAVPEASLGETTAFSVGTTPDGHATDRRSQGLPLFAVEHTNSEVVIEPPVFSVHSSPTRRDPGAPLFAPVAQIRPTAAPGALGSGSAALPPFSG